MVDTGHRSENVAFDAFSCATVPVLSEGGPAKWLKNKNLQNHLCDYEPGGREFESLRARAKFAYFGLNIPVICRLDRLNTTSRGRVRPVKGRVSAWSVAIPSACMRFLSYFFSTPEKNLDSSNLFN